MDINVKQLEKQRFQIRIQIRELILRNKPVQDIKNKVQEYCDITSQLSKFNKNIKIKSEHLCPQYWDNHTPADYIKNRENKTKHKQDPTVVDTQQHRLQIITKQPKHKVVEKTKKIIKEYNCYIIKIAWDDKDGTYKTIFDTHIKPYIQQLPLKYKTDDYSEFDNRQEWMYTYEYNGSSDAFDILKTSLAYFMKAVNMKAEVFGRQK